MAVEYFKSGDNYFAEIENRIVIANVKSNEYHMYDVENADVFIKIIRSKITSFGVEKTFDWNSIRPCSPEFEREIYNEKLLSLENNMVRVLCNKIEEPISAINRLWPDKFNLIKIKYAIIFLVSFSVTAILNMTQKPRVHYKYLELTKRLFIKKDRNPDDLRRACTVAYSMRPFLYRSKNKCYFDSFVTSHYLILLGWNAQWTFAVAIEPFRAHCWVQVDGIVVNDSLSSIFIYKPLFKI